MLKNFEPENNLNDGLVVVYRMPMNYRAKSDYLEIGRCKANEDIDVWSSIEVKTSDKN